MTGLQGFRAATHPQQVEVRGQLDLVGDVDTARQPTDDRATPPDLFDPLDRRFGFTVDAAASPDNAKVARYWTKETDGLSQPWAGERVWCNPPYSDLGAWVRKAWAEWETDCEDSLFVLLLPSNRTEQAWWQDHIEPFRDRPGSAIRTEFLRDRRRFIMPGETVVRPNQRPPFGLVLCIWGWWRESLPLGAVASDAF